MPIVFNIPNTVQRFFFKKKIYSDIWGNLFTVSPYKSETKLHTSYKIVQAISLFQNGRRARKEKQSQIKISRGSSKLYSSVIMHLNVWRNYLSSDKFRPPLPLQLIHVACDLSLGPALLYTLNFPLWTSMAPVSPTSWDVQGNLGFTFLPSHIGLSGSP